MVLIPAVAVPADYLAFRGRIRPRVYVGEVSVGGKGLDTATSILASAARKLSNKTIRFERQGQVVSATLAELGWRPDPGATAAAAMAVGQEGDLAERIRTRARTWARSTRVAWEGGWDQAALDRVIQKWLPTVGREPVEGAVSAVGTAVVTTDPIAGRSIEADAVRSLAESVANGGARPPFLLPTVPIPALTSAADVETAAHEVRGMLDGPVVVRLEELRIEIAPEELAPLVRTRVDTGTEPVEGPDATQAGSLRVEFNVAAVRRLFAPYRDQVGTEPVPATFVTTRDRVRIRESVPGTRFDPELAAQHLLRVARSEGRRGRIPLAPVESDFTSRDARAMGIVEKVSEFTTAHAAGEPRVTNIHLAADLLDGTTVGPGATFSMNQTLGQRTPDRGFVLAPAIYDGQFVQAYGGGVSQLATTLFNAAFFGGYPFREYRAHSQYISRYPLGREATVSWPDPDLVFENDTPTAILITTEYTATTITVRIFGDRHGRKATATDPVIVGRGADAYTVLVQRIVNEGGKEVRRDRFLTYYRNG